jgi:hypothetical protein
MNTALQTALTEFVKALTALVEVATEKVKAEK